MCVCVCVIVYVYKCSTCASHTCTTTSIAYGGFPICHAFIPRSHLSSIPSGSGSPTYASVWVGVPASERVCCLSVCVCVYHHVIVCVFAMCGVVVVSVLPSSIPPSPLSVSLECDRFLPSPFGRTRFGPFLVSPNRKSNNAKTTPASQLTCVDSAPRCPHVHTLMFSVY